MCEYCEWEELLGRIEECLEDDDYYWALDTLEGIWDTVTSNKCCTDRQRQAVNNIIESVEQRR